MTSVSRASRRVGARVNSVNLCPALKHFFKCDEPAGATILQDSIRGVRATTVASIVKNDEYSVQMSVSNTTNLTLGDWYPGGATSLPLLLMAVYVPASSGITSKINIGGTATTGKLSIIPSGSSGVVLSSGGVSASLSLPVATFSPTYVHGYVVTATFGASSTGTINGMRDLNGVVTWATQATHSITSVDLLNKLYIDSSPTAFYGIAVYAFASALPSTADIETAVRWAKTNWILGDKRSPPIFDGLL